MEHAYVDVITYRGQWRISAFLLRNSSGDTDFFLPTETYIKLKDFQNVNFLRVPYSTYKKNNNDKSPVTEQ
jgi:hypothetical protein